MVKDSKMQIASGSDSKWGFASSSLYERVAFILFLNLLSFSGFVSAQDNLAGSVVLITGGQASVERGGQLDRLQKNNPVYEGDVILTGATTFVHVKMSDDAFLAIRPNSALKVDCYKTQLGEQSCLRFELLRGEVRTVSGHAAKANRDRFRLNTPVAAIGVKGTDFITKVTSQGTTLVRVVQGQIVASPLGDGCPRVSLGSCVTVFSTGLSESDSFMLEVLPGQLPGKVELSALQLGKAVEQEVSAGGESDSTKLVRKGAIDDVVRILADDPVLLQKYLGAAELYLGDVDGFVESDQALVFSFWNNQFDGMNSPVNLASQGRVVTVGDGQTALWRKEGMYRPGAGQVSFNLQQSQGALVDSSGSAPVKVVDSLLNINFDSRMLETRLGVLMPDGLEKQYSVQKRMGRDDGIFAFTDDNGARFYGAVANDGKSVGYMLNDRQQESLLKVQTLWQAK